MTKVLFVCLGNICRSPVAQGVFEHLIKEAGLEHLIEVDSAGTSAEHEGEMPDRRSQKNALSHGILIGHQRSRPVTYTDFSYYDYIVPMDSVNYQNLLALGPRVAHSKIKKLMDYTPLGGDVPDPYEQGEEGFEIVYQLITQGVQGLIEAIRKSYNLSGSSDHKS